MTLTLAAIIIGLFFLVLSSNWFIEGAVSLARFYHLPSLFIGMVVIGFGTSAPELMVSAISSWQGNPQLALGNAFGSNIANIALILGITSLIKPIMVHRDVIKKELPILILTTLIIGFLIWDLEVSRLDAFFLLLTFAIIMGWSIFFNLKNKNNNENEKLSEQDPSEKKPTSLKKSYIYLVGGVTLLLASSRLLVWGAVEMATFLGVSELMMGLTIIAVGTSLPELASSIAAASKGESDLALGNIIGSNLFNGLVVVGIAGFIKPMELTSEVINRDLLVILGLTISLFFMGFGFKGRLGRISRFYGVLLVASYIIYATYLVKNS
jgi:cation:H+ antiporter